MENYLRKLYKNFLNFKKFYFILDAKNNATSLDEIKLPKKILEDFYKNYSITSFCNFLYNLKIIIYSKNIFDFVLENFSEDWDLWLYLKFLENEKVIKVKKNGSIALLKKDIIKIIPAPKSEGQIKEKLEKTLNLKIKNNDLVTNLFKDQRFKAKGSFDQMPISQESAIFVVKKILNYLPLNKKFLFVGDDDFISVILGIVAPNVESLVVDADQQVLDCINDLAEKFNLKIETKKVDITKKKHLNEKVVGFLANPVYTEAGVKEFVNFGKNQLGNDGGFGFLEVGDESIENRFLFLQDFFTKNNLIIKELIKNKIYYPYIEIYREDKEILKRLSAMIDKKIIKNSPKLGASLYVFEYLPFKPKSVKFKRPIYAYI